MSTQFGYSIWTLNLNLVWLNGWVFIYKLSGCGFVSRCSHLNFRFHACFEQGVPWHSENYRAWIHSETHTWHDKNIQSKALYRKVFTTQLNHLASLPKWLSVHLWTKWLWIQVLLQSLKLQMSRLFWARGFLTFRQL